MARSLYLAAAGPESGKSAVALAVLEAMRRRVGRVAAFRPVVRASGPGSRDEDPVLALLRGRLPRGSDGWGVSYDDVHADPEAAIGTIVERYHELETGHDAVLVVGTDYTDVGAPTELAFNGLAALNLGAPVLLVVGGNGRSAGEVLAAAELASGSLLAQSCQLLGVIANRVGATELSSVRAGLAHRPGSAVLPEITLLSAPSVRQVLDAAGGELVFGEPSRAGREVLGTIVAAMNLPRVLSALEEHQLVIVPGDRSDILVGVLTAHASHTFPRLSGVLLTGGIQPDPIVSRLIEGLRSGLPVATTRRNTFDSAVIASATRGALTDGSPRKIEAALEVFNAHVDLTGLLDRLDLARSVAVTPLMFEHDLVERARARRMRIVLPEGTEPRVLKAAARVLERGIADVVLLGDRHEVEVVAGRAGVDVAAATVLDPHEEGLRHRLAAEYARRRAHKGITLDHALDVVVDVSYAGTLMVALGEADGMVSGAVHTTAHTIRPSFEVIKTIPGVSVVSSVFFMCLADRVLVYGDCAVNPDPTAEQLADIAISSAATAASFGVEPRVAMLSYSTGESGVGADVDKVRAATRLVRERAPDLLVEGPIQYDAAIDLGVARTKMPESDVAGHATVLIFPDLNTGNNTYKAVQRSAGVLAVGPVLQGLRRPVNDLSRGATVADIVTTIAITAVQAQSIGGQRHEAPPAVPAGVHA